MSSGIKNVTVAEDIISSRFNWASKAALIVDLSLLSSLSKVMGQLIQVSLAQKARVQISRFKECEAQLSLTN